MPDLDSRLVDLVAQAIRIHSPEGASATAEVALRALELAPLFGRYVDDDATRVRYATRWLDVA